MVIKSAEVVSAPTRMAEKHLSRRLLAMARAARAGTLMCVAESETFCQLMQSAARGLRLVAASPSKKVCHDLAEQGVETLQLPVRFINRFKQAQFAVAMAAQKNMLAPGERLVCSVRSSVAGSDFMLVLETGKEGSAFALHELVKQTEGIRPAVVEATMEVACEIARAARRGKRLGAIFMLGDSGGVLEGSRQLVPNPFLQLDPKQRSLLSSSIRELLVELAKLDGAFVARGDGLIETAGTFLTANPAHVLVPQGLGTRHLAAAAVTARTRAMAVVVSATDGHIRVFTHGELVLHVDVESL